jgi:FkbM family methyltransferase
MLFKQALINLKMEQKYFYSQNYLSEKKSFWKNKIFKYLTKDSLPLFTRGGDLISINTQTLGIHEQIITHLIKIYNKQGYSDFLLDIGANIGLTTCQNGEDFKQIHLFEPNPLCQRIAEVNIMSFLKNPSWTLHPYGLGSSDYKAKLILPKKNWGGAWIRSMDQSYNIQILFGKEGANHYDSDLYNELDVEIKSAKDILKNIFSSLFNSNLKSGVIKIDIEGMEPCVLKAIADSIPKEMSAMIVFESFDRDLNLDLILKDFGNRAKPFMIECRYPYLLKSNNLKKLFKLIFNRTILYQIIPFDLKKRKESSQKDFILQIQNLNDMLS